MIVSACIITYNHEKFIEECLIGAINQLLDYDYEIVIGDDCSSDKTSEICEVYAKKYPDIIKYFRRNKNLGMIGNWIETIKNCSGKYIALCEGDDYWTDPHKLQKQVFFLEKNKDYVLTCTDGIFAVKNENLNYTNEKTISRTFGLEDILKENICLTASVVFRSESINNLPNFLHKTKWLDYALWIYLLETGKGYLSNEKAVAYRIHNEGAWGGLKLAGGKKKQCQMSYEFYTLIAKYQKSEIIKNHITKSAICILKIIVNQEFETTIKKNKAWDNILLMKYIIELNSIARIYNLRDYFYLIKKILKN